MSYFKRFNNVDDILIVLSLFIYGIFYSYSYVLIKQRAGADYIFSIPGKTLNDITGHPADLPGILIGIFSNYELLILELFVVFSILALRPAVLRRYPRFKPLFTGFMTGIVAVGFYQGLLNYYNVQSIGLPVQPADGTPGSLALLAICDAAGLVLSYRPLRRMKKLDIKPHEIALVLVILAIMVSVIAVTITVVTNVELSGIPATGTTGATTGTTSNPSATITPTTAPGNPQSPTTRSYGVDPLMLVALAMLSVIVICVTVSYFILDELSVLYRIFIQLLRPLWSSGSKKATTFNYSDQRSTAHQLQISSRPPGYADDISRLAQIHAKFGYEHEEYISMVNRLSDKYSIDTAQIDYDQWSMQKT